MCPAEVTRLSRAVGETLSERLSASEGSEFGSPRRKPKEPRVVSALAMTAVILPG